MCELWSLILHKEYMDSMKAWGIVTSPLSIHLLIRLTKWILPPRQERGRDEGLGITEGVDTIKA